MEHSEKGKTLAGIFHLLTLLLYCMKPSNAENLGLIQIYVLGFIFRTNYQSEIVSSLSLVQCIQVTDGYTNQANAGRRKACHLTAPQREHQKDKFHHLCHLEGNKY